MIERGSQFIHKPLQIQTRSMSRAQMGLVVSGPARVVTWSNRGLIFYSNFLHSCKRIRWTECHVSRWAGQWPVEGVNIFVLVSTTLAVFRHIEGLVQFLPFVEVVEIWNNNRHGESNGQHSWYSADRTNYFTSQSERSHVSVSVKRKRHLNLI